jgi:hypothetical protein
MKSRSGIDRPKDGALRRPSPAGIKEGGKATFPCEPMPIDALTAQRTRSIEVLWTRFEARDWAGARRLFADAATLTWHCTGERFLDADAIIRVNAIYPEGWRIRIVEVNALLDGRVHSVVEVSHAASRFLANSMFRFDAGLIAQVDEYWATVEAPAAWRTPEAIGAYERLAAP